MRNIDTPLKNRQKKIQKYFSKESIQIVNEHKSDKLH